MEKLLTRKEAAKLLGISIDTLDARERLCVLYGAEPSGIHSPVNAQGKTEGSQYRLNIQNSEIPGAKVTSLIEHRAS